MSYTRLSNRGQLMRATAHGRMQAEPVRVGAQHRGIFPIPAGNRSQARHLLSGTRLSRPGVRMKRVTAALVALVAPVVAIWLLAAVALLGAAPEARSALIFGET